MNKPQGISQIRYENNKKEYNIYKNDIEKELGKTLEIIEYENIPYYKDNQNVAFVTLTTDPEFDTPEIMKRFAISHGAKSQNWDFLTGEKSEIVRLAVDELKLTVLDKPEREQASPEDMFIHSSYFVVLDKQGRLRGALESLEEGWKEKAIDIATELLEK